MRSLFCWHRPSLAFQYPPMPAYLIARVQVTDWERYREYTRATPAAIESFGGRFIVRGGETITLEGPQETGRVVIIEFPSLDQAKAFYHSEEYSRAKRLREGAQRGSSWRLRDVPFEIPSASNHADAP